MKCPLFVYPVCLPCLFTLFVYFVCLDCLFNLFVYPVCFPCLFTLFVYPVCLMFLPAIILQIPLPYFSFVNFWGDVCVPGYTNSFAVVKLSEGQRGEQRAQALSHQHIRELFQLSSCLKDNVGNKEPKPCPISIFMNFCSCQAV